VRPANIPGLTELFGRNGLIRVIHSSLFELCASNQLFDAYSTEVATTGATRSSASSGSRGRPRTRHQFTAAFLLSASVLPLSFAPLVPRLLPAGAGQGFRKPQLRDRFLIHQGGRALCRTVYAPMINRPAMACASASSCCWNLP